MLVNGTWSKDWDPVQKSDEKGRFVRQTSSFRSWITPDGSAGPTGDAGFKAEPGRYRLYVAFICPWASRTLMARKLKGLDQMIAVTVVNPTLTDQGWAFGGYPGADDDPLFGSAYMHELYTRADPQFTGRATVPVLWDKQTSTIVNNESADILRMLDTAFEHLVPSDLRLYPTDLGPEIDALNADVYQSFNNGVYKAGFATTQSAYDKAVRPLFDSLDWIDCILSENRYLLGDRITEADWRLFTTLIRFDPVYHLHFKCNRRRLIDYPNLWACTRELYQWPGVSGTVRVDHFVRHYHYSHATINPNRILPINPVLDYDEPHRRDQRSAA